MKWADLKQDEKGASALEFALILPILILLLFGIIEFGIILYDKAMITNASREGARSGITVQSPRMSTEDITNIVDSYCSDYLLTFDPENRPPTVKVMVNSVESNPGITGLTGAEDYLTVQVSYNYKFLLLPGLINDMAGTIPIQASTTMRAE